MRFVIIALLLTNALWFALYQRQSRAYQKLVEQSWGYYSDARANDRAATECALRTGYKYNCADGTQSATCY